ncbi:hypothetical protein ZWY2020_041277 [Hordeum vulgare]|nr:hypothetical protein ZWY2020_041277 [Hordeum vulgare]
MCRCGAKIGGDLGSSSQALDGILGFDPPLVSWRARPLLRRGAGDSVPLSPTPTGSPTGGSASLAVLLFGFGLIFPRTLCSIGMFFFGSIFRKSHVESAYVSTLELPALVD